MNTSSQRVAVIGGTGFIGSHFVYRAVRQGATTLAVARSASRLSNLAEVDGHFEFAECDITDPQRISDLLSKFKPDAVVHFAAEPDSSETPEHMLKCIHVNTTGVLNTVQAAAEAGAETFVFADTSKVYGNATVPFTAAHPEAPICSYAVAKASAWQFCKLVSSLRGINVVSLRPAFVYGPRQNWNLINYVKQCVDKGVPVRLQGGSQTRDLLYVEDAVEAFMRAISAPAAWGNAIPVGGGSEQTIAELCKKMLSVLGSNAPIETGAEQPRPTEIWRSYTDNADAKRLLRWSPRTPLTEGLQVTLGLKAIPDRSELGGSEHEDAMVMTQRVGV